MKYIKATSKDAETVFAIVQDSIANVYPKYYPTEVVDFFSKLHSLENISKDIDDGLVGILIDNDKCVGTGCYRDNHITRLYVKSDCQGKGYGTFIMDYLENEIKKHHSKVNLDASLPACRMYQKRGYATIEHCRHIVDNGVVLAYEIMEKGLSDNRTKIDYDGRIFVPLVNSENGEVDGSTTFRYHQSGTDFQADYTGGDIKIGSMVGTVSENGELDFYYQHLNVNGEIRVGKCHSVPQINSNGKIELHEQWQWLNGDCSSGSSIVVEKDDFSTEKK